METNLFSQYVDFALNPSMQNRKIHLVDGENDELRPKVMSWGRRMVQVLSDSLCNLFYETLAIKRLQVVENYTAAPREHYLAIKRLQVIENFTAALRENYSEKEMKRIEPQLNDLRNSKNRMRVRDVRKIIGLVGPREQKPLMAGEDRINYFKTVELQSRENIFRKRIDHHLPTRKKVKLTGKTVKLKTAHKRTKKSDYTEKYDFDKTIPLSTFLSNLDDRTYEDPRGPIHLFSKCINRDISWANKCLMELGGEGYQLPGSVTRLPDTFFVLNTPFWTGYSKYRYSGYDSIRDTKQRAQGLDINEYDELSEQQFELLGLETQGQNIFGLNVKELRLIEKDKSKQDLAFRNYAELYNKIVVDTCFISNKEINDADKAEIVANHSILQGLDYSTLRVGKILENIEQISVLLQAMHVDYGHDDPESFLKNMTKLYCVNNGFRKYTEPAYRKFYCEDLILLALRVGFTRVDAYFGKEGLERLTTWLEPFRNIICSAFMTKEALPMKKSLAHISTFPDLWIK